MRFALKRLLCGKELLLEKARFNLKKVAILQSNYIPWRGYFDMIAAVDEFIFYDDMQFTRRDWRNRNQIKTPQGLQWLTVPVKVKGKYHQTIRETEIDGTHWAKSHWRALTQNYRRARHFEEVAGLFEPFYLQRPYAYLSPLNRALIEAVCAYLGISTKISHSWDYSLIDGKTERLADLCTQAGGTEYISGPAAKEYIEDRVFTERCIKLSWFDYTGYPEYPQLWGDFIHGVSILDLLFNCGRDAPRYMKHVGIR
jgi:WbqC-like protein family